MCPVLRVCCVYVCWEDVLCTSVAYYHYFPKVTKMNGQSHGCFGFFSTDAEFFCVYLCLET